MLKEPARDNPGAVPFPWRAVAAAAVAGGALRAGVTSWLLHGRPGLTWERLALGHDAAEYVAFGRALAALDLTRVPPDALRHHAGFPALVMVPALAAFPRTPAVAAVVAGWALTGATLWVGASVMRRHFGAEEGADGDAAECMSDRRVALWCFAAATAYPAQVYFGLFALAEPLFTLLLTAGVVLWADGRRAGAYGLLAVAALTRGAALPAAAALAALDAVLAGGAAWRAADPATFPHRRPHGARTVRAVRAAAARAAWFGVVAVPYVAWQAVLRRAWGADTLAIMAPAFGPPFATWPAAMAEAGAARSVYVSACVAAVAAGLAAHGARAWRGRSGADSSAFRLAAGTAAAGAAFVVFHACIARLNYLGRPVAVFTYHDRYLAPLVPLALMAAAPWLRWWMVAPAAAASVALSAWWAKGYLAAAAASASAGSG